MPRPTGESMNEHLEHEGPIAIGPSAEVTTEAEWAQWLSGSIEPFAGDLSNAATLMAALTGGKNYVYEKLTGKGLKTFVKPVTTILLRDDVATSPICEANKGRLIAVKKSFLECLSQYDMQEMCEVTRADGAVAFRGILPDMFRLAGIEETHHAAFDQIKKGAEGGIDPLTTTVAEYDARENEYRALHWQLRYATEMAMPELTTDLLRERIGAAAAVRESRQD